jgi:UDP-glucose 4-epimerase
MTKSLVTGGSGFIGSNLVDYLVEQGHEVIVLDDRSANNDKFYTSDKVEYVKQDVTNYQFTRLFYDGVDYVFHLAAESRLQPAIENPINAVQKNCVGTAVVLQCAREAGVKRVVYSSTSSGYGGNPWPNVETQPDDCLDLYGLETVSLRYFNVFGERSPARGQYAPVIGIFQRQQAAGEPLTLVGDGGQRRDFIHVKDVARANFLAATKDLGEHVGGVFNVGSGKNYSIKEIALSISDKLVYLPERSGEASTTLANIDKIKNVIGWEPEIDVIDWINGQE